MSKIIGQEYNPHAPILNTELTRIIQSPEKLKLWNHAVEQALEKQPDEQVIQNVRATAALIILSEKSIASQNFELMRAMQLFDSTLSIKDVGLAAGQSIKNTLVSKVSDALTPAEPESMNLASAQARSQALLETPKTLATGIYNTLHTVWQNPHIVYESAQHIVTGIKTQLAQGVSSSNPSNALGALIGAGGVNLALNTVNPLKKMQWAEYANTLGSGTVLPHAIPYRDFSDKITFKKSSLGGSEFNFQPENNHQITGVINEDSELFFTIQAKGDREKNGSGSDLFLSMFNASVKNNIPIKTIYAAWWPGELGTNHTQFLNIYYSGASIRDAAAGTFTGKMATKLGLTQANTEKIEQALKYDDHSKFLTSFSHPDWGAGEQMNEYSLAYSRAHGRPDLALTPIGNADHVKNLLSEVNKLPEHQQSAVMQHLHNNLITLQDQELKR